MAKDMGDNEFAQRCRKIFDSGSRLSVERLWDGEYFVQKVDLKQVSRRTSTATAAWPTSSSARAGRIRSGSGYIYPQENVKLGAAVDLEVQLGAGRRAAEHARTRRSAGSRCPARRACSPAPGPRASTSERRRALSRRGLDGHRVPGGRQHDLGGHGHRGPGRSAAASTTATSRPSTTRATRSSAATITPARWPVGACSPPCRGFEYHGPKGHIGFAPRISPDDFRAAFTAAEGWGTFAQMRSEKSQREQVALRWGRLNLKSLAFTVPADWKAVSVAARVGDKSVNSRAAVQNDRVQIELAEPVRLSEGQEMEIMLEPAMRTSNRWIS